jgi:hypothetical protein
MFIVYRLLNCETHVTYMFDVNTGKLLDWEGQMTEPTSRQRGRPTETRQQLSGNNLRTESNIWSQVPEWTRYLDILTDWPSVVKWLRLREQKSSYWRELQIWSKSGQDKAVLQDAECTVSHCGCGWGQFENPGRRMSAFGSRYKRAGVGQTAPQWSVTKCCKVE